MRSRLHPLSFAQLGTVYRITRQAAAGLVHRHGYALATDPERLFVHLLESCRAGKVRRLLSDPTCRAAIAAQLAILARQ